MWLPILIRSHAARAQTQTTQPGKTRTFKTYVNTPEHSSAPSPLCSNPGGEEEGKDEELWNLKASALINSWADFAPRVRKGSAGGLERGGKRRRHTAFRKRDEMKLGNSQLECFSLPARINYNTSDVHFPTCHRGLWAKTQKCSFIWVLAPCTGDIICSHSHGLPTHTPARPITGRAQLPIAMFCRFCGISKLVKTKLIRENEDLSIRQHDENYLKWPKTAL